MKKTIEHHIEDLKEYSNRIIRTTKDHTEEEFSRDQDLQDAMLRRVQVIGEIVKRIPDDFKKKYPDIPWRAIAGTRDKVSHDYDGLDLSLVWRIAEKDIPDLVKELNKLPQTGEDLTYETKN